MCGSWQTVSSSSERPRHVWQHYLQRLHEQKGRKEKKENGWRSPITLMEGLYRTGRTGGTSAVVQFMADGLSVLRAATTHIANTIYKSYISGREEKKRKENGWRSPITVLVS